MKFALVGAAGFVAPRHMQAIKDVGGDLIAALDPHDSVGVLDRYTKHAAFFTEPERFERFLHKNQVDYLSICSPNYLHDAHIRMGLNAGCHVIVEKPAVLNPENMDALLELAQQRNRHVWTVLQLRLHPAVQQLVRMVGGSHDRHKVLVSYVTPRGVWYHHSWKGDVEKSGGIVANIGVHLFDLLLHVFGRPLPNKGAPHKNSVRGNVGVLDAHGWLELAHADVEWALSVRPNRQSERRLEVNGIPIDLTTGFDDAHTRVYAEIMEGRGVGMEECREAINVCWRLRCG